MIQLDVYQKVKRLQKYVAWASAFIAFFGIGGGAIMYISGLKVFGVVWTILGSLASIILPVSALKDLKADYIEND
ncbi:hypothetical protein [Calidifontibacillus erzurumensis]|uniref:Uncharacterized protein n=1 Tax=Calidifontibacillus erzurumensis TaxID=2741433 RepID=A0A8J8KCB8_9BACI|nr:hypothetical protein [Calidifontibacillus erzurumensis]NSL52462.1 hypothetical protein [Calidifontibacillus erzurumensis]